MRRFLMTVLAVAILAPASLALAQETAEEGEVQTRFYDFNDMLIDGEFIRPEGMFTRARDRARFQRLLDLRREFIEEIEESAKEEVLE